MLREQYENPGNAQKAMQSNAFKQADFPVQSTEEGSTVSSLMKNEQQIIFKANITFVKQNATEMM